MHFSLTGSTCAAVVALVSALLISTTATSAARADSVFWSDSASNQIWQADLDGAAAHVVLQLAVGAEPRGIAINTPGGHLYWAAAKVKNCSSRSGCGRN